MVTRGRDALPIPADLRWIPNIRACRIGSAAIRWIGDELAATRALEALSNRLLDATSDDIRAIEDHEVHLKS